MVLATYMEPEWIVVWKSQTASFDTATNASSSTLLSTRWVVFSLQTACPGLGL